MRACQLFTSIEMKCVCNSIQLSANACVRFLCSYTQMRLHNTTHALLFPCSLLTHYYICTNDKSASTYTSKSPPPPTPICYHDESHSLVIVTFTIIYIIFHVCSCSLSVGETCLFVSILRLPSLWGVYLYERSARRVFADKTRWQ